MKLDFSFLSNITGIFADFFRNLDSLELMSLIIFSSCLRFSRNKHNFVDRFVRGEQRSRARELFHGRNRYKIVFINVPCLLQGFGKIDVAKKTSGKRQISKFQNSLKHELILPRYLRQRQHKITVKVQY